MSRCEATKPAALSDGIKQCKRPTWGNTRFCYQHAIANGEAVVVSPFMLAVAVSRVVGTDEARRVGPAIWADLMNPR